MNVSHTTAVQQALRAAETAEPQNQGAQILMLKKALDAQKAEAAQRLRLVEGKGQNLDIRV